MGHEHLPKAFTSAHPLVKQNKFTFDGFADLLREKCYSPIRIPEKKLVQLIRKYNPGFTITPQDRAMLAQRAELAKHYREVLIAHNLNRAKISYELNIPTHDRPLQHFLSYSNTEAAQQHNNMWRELLKQSREEQAKAMYRHIKESTIPTALKALEMNTDEFLANYAQNEEAFSIIMELDSLLKEYPFTEEQKKELTPLRSLQLPLGERLSSIDIIASPIYSVLPVEKLGDCIERESFYNSLKALGTQYGEYVPNPEEGDMPPGPSTFSGQILRGQLATLGSAMQGRLQYEILSKGGDPRLVFSMDGNRLSNDQMCTAMRMGHPLLVSIPEQGMVPILPTPNSDPPKYLSGEAATQALTRTMAAKTNELLRRCKNATPWWMTGGSPEFAAMEQAMNRFARLSEGVTFPVSEDNIADLMSAAQELRASSKTYLEYKKAQLGEKMAGANGQLQGKNARETNRLQTAAALDGLGRQMEFLLNCQIAPQTISDVAKEALQQDDAEAAIRAAREAELERQLLEEQERILAANQLPAEQLCHATSEQLMGKISSIKNLPAPEQKYNGDILPSEHGSLYGIHSMLARFALSKNALEPQNASSAYGIMARIVCYHLIQQERFMNSPQNEGQPFVPGIIETHLTELSKQNKLSSDPVFRKVIGEPLTPARIGQFLMNDEGKTLGIKYLDELTRDAQKDNDLAIAAQRTKEHYIPPSQKSVNTMDI